MQNRSINKVKILEIAEKLGLEMGKFTKDMKLPDIESLIVRDVRNGRQVGVRGTPAIFVNGKILKNRSLGGFNQMIEAELKKDKLEN
jgi:protein-disulfide isomerase